jgi:Membrane bound beta barrel domain (DUF5777)
MKKFFSKFMKILPVVMITSMFFHFNVVAQDEGESEEPKKVEKPVRSPYETGSLIETQTHLVLPKKTLEFVIQHRFGKFNSGEFDLLGIYGPSNIRIGLNYGLFKNAQIGFGTTKNNRLQDLNWKYKILTQTRSNSMPIGLTYYGNIQYDARGKENFGAEYKTTNRLAYFHQLILARKFSSKLTLQISGSYAHYNQIDTIAFPGLDHDNFGVGFGGRYKFSPQGSIIFEYDQPLSTPDQIKPNLSLGVEIATSSHSFHIFITTYSGISYQRNLMYNTNDFTNGDVMLGFNITRNWNF